MFATATTICCLWGLQDEKLEKSQGIQINTRMRIKKLMWFYIYNNWNFIFIIHKIVFIFKRNNNNNIIYLIFF